MSEKVEILLMQNIAFGQNIREKLDLFSPVLPSFHKDPLLIIF